MKSDLNISQWNNTHPQWSRLREIIDQLEQTAWVNYHAEWHHQSIILVAEYGVEPVGFLRYVLQTIGLAEDLQAVTLNNQPLLEAKVIAFGVIESMRRLGVGRQLQQTLIEVCQQAGCYQIRSHSSLKNSGNHQLKLSMGYAIHPLVSTEKKDGYYFVLPLQKIGNPTV